MSKEEWMKNGIMLWTHWLVLTKLSEHGTEGTTIGSIVDYLLVYKHQKYSSNSLGLMLGKMKKDGLVKLIQKRHKITQYFITEKGKELLKGVKHRTHRRM